MNGGRCKWKRGLQTGGGMERASEQYHRNQENVPSVQGAAELRRTRVITRFGK